ncbi:MAG: aminotransferase class V-fold PLP-dependent enzyme, partial [Clostridia bacterium]|nr:aminotransferase class V-fold PLP-dependent enzyme [Clostridia bacterium]
LEPLALLKNSGVEIVQLSTKGGKISLDEVREAVNERTILISIMAVNNETGAIYDLKSIFSLAKRLNPNIITHTDCVQGFMKIPFSPETVMADAVSLSAHKIHGPKGVGALLLAKQLIPANRITPLLYGGGQEGGMRSGTENVFGIVGFGAAAKEAAASLSTFRESSLALREAFLTALPEGVKVNQPEIHTACYFLAVLVGAVPFAAQGSVADVLNSQITVFIKRHTRVADVVIGLEVEILTHGGLEVIGIHTGVVAIAHQVAGQVEVLNRYRTGHGHLGNFQGAFAGIAQRVGVEEHSLLPIFADEPPVADSYRRFMQGSIFLIIGHVVYFPLG